MSEATLFSDLLKSAPTASSLSGLSMLLVNTLGQLLQSSGLPLVVKNYWADLDEVSESSILRLSAAASNAPVSPLGCVVIDLHWDSNTAMQLLFYAPSQQMFVRFRSFTWRSWRELAFVSS